jgi:hypothetical protein
MRRRRRRRLPFGRRVGPGHTIKNRLRMTIVTKLLVETPP